MGRGPPETAILPATVAHNPTAALMEMSMWPHRMTSVIPMAAIAM
jgi:hypothetical protein